MNIVENGPPDLEAIAEEILEPLRTWLASISCTPAKFCEVMRTNDSFLEAKPAALGISQDQFFEGINGIPSLPIYASILGISVKMLWVGFEAHRYIMPEWLIESLEEAVVKSPAFDL